MTDEAVGWVFSVRAEVNGYNSVMEDAEDDGGGLLYNEAVVYNESCIFPSALLSCTPGLDSNSADWRPSDAESWLSLII